MEPHFRHTPQRTLVLRTVKASREFRTAEEIFQTVKRQFPAIGIATVYRNLEVLKERGEIFAFEGSDRVKRYAGFVFHNAVFTCQKCGQVESLALKNLEQVVERVAKGRTVFFSRLDVRGLCAEHAVKPRL